MLGGFTSKKRCFIEGKHKLQNIWEIKDNWIENLLH